jgi:Flavinator of succinate dehydrogenase
MSIKYLFNHSSIMTSLIPRIVSCSSPIPPSCLLYSKPVIPLICRRLSSSAKSPIDDSFLPRPIDRSYETSEVTRARLLYQSRKRGILETDLLLSTFAHKNLPTMSNAEMQEYDKVCHPRIKTNICSYWTNQIGRSIIGLHRRNLFQKNGKTVQFSDY